MSDKKVNPQKAAVVENLKGLVSQAKSIAIVDYKGLKVNQAVDLRRTIKKAGGQFVVTKNTLFSLALKANNYQLEADLEGSSAFVFSLTDEISAIKALADFAKKNAIPSFKLGFLGDRVLSQAEISALAALPGKDVLIAQTVGSLEIPHLSFGI